MPPPLLPALTPEEWSHRRLVTADDVTVRRIQSGLVFTLGTARILVRAAPDLFGVAALALYETEDAEGRQFGFPRRELAALQRVTNTLTGDVERLTYLREHDLARVTEHDRQALLALGHRIRMLMPARRMRWRSPRRGA